MACSYFSIICISLNGVSLVHCTLSLCLFPSSLSPLEGYTFFTRTLLLQWELFSQELSGLVCRGSPVRQGHVWHYRGPKSFSFISSGFTHWLMQIHTTHWARFEVDFLCLFFLPLFFCFLPLVFLFPPSCLFCCFPGVKGRVFQFPFYGLAFRFMKGPLSRGQWCLGLWAQVPNPGINHVPLGAPL